MSAEWIPIALSRDVPAGVTRAALLDGKELVIWRGDGPAHVWEDRCPHRGMRLSLGFVRNDSLNCLYHGWQYGPSSSCIRIPAHPDLTVAPTIKANAYEAAEAGELIWVRLAGNGAPPDLRAEATPVLSLAIQVDGLNEPHLVVPFEGARLHLRWHHVSPGRIMVHVVLEGAADVGRAAAFIRTMRNELEEGVAA